MSLSAECKAVCDYCAKKVERNVKLNSRTAQSIISEGLMSATSYASDIWSWCLPGGWIQHGDERGFPYVFCCIECCEAWLREHDMDEEADTLKNATWMA